VISFAPPGDLSAVIARARRGFDILQPNLVGTKTEARFLLTARTPGPFIYLERFSLYFKSYNIYIYYIYIYII